MGTDHGFSNYPKTWSVPFFSSQSPAVSRNIDTWGAAHDANERKVLDLYGNNRRMTNPSLRYNHLKAGL